MFFNSNQAKIAPKLLSVIERYGLPSIVATSGRLRIVCGDSICPQTLYVLETSNELPELIGVIVYMRDGDTLAVLLVAVRKDYTQQARMGENPILLEMIEAVRNIGRRIKGIQSVSIFPGTAKELRLPVVRK
jgi:hypothetical protein